MNHGTSADGLPWIEVSKTSPCFVTASGEPWTPIGHNDAICWPSLDGLFGRSDPARVESYLSMLRSHGVTVLRLMLEYSEGDGYLLENPCGNFVPEVIQFWDDFIPVCERAGMRLLLTPYDTFWMWDRWEPHPYSRRNGGPCADRGRLLLCTETREAMKRRLEFATRRWGASGAVFAWDVYNEIHPRFALGSAEVFTDFVTELSNFLRELELREHGRTHPQTISFFGPDMPMDPERISACIYRHPCLDFASTHLYETDTIDFPRNTVDPAIATARLIREALAETREGRPLFDSESGPIHAFKDHGITLAESYDDEVFRHMQWAHFAAGGAGGGMRWPNRVPHVLTRGMHCAQRALAGFLPLIDWPAFRRRNLNEEVRTNSEQVAAAACGDAAQAVVWLLRTNCAPRGRIEENGIGCMLPRDAEPLAVDVSVPALAPGRYRVTAWDTGQGRAVAAFECFADRESLRFETPGIVTDMAFAITRIAEPVPKSKL
jgi:mannan endo-1,4-beta-mannosidase